MIFVKCVVVVFHIPSTPASFGDYVASGFTANLTNKQTFLARVIGGFLKRCAWTSVKPENLVNA